MSSKKLVIPEEGRKKLTDVTSLPYDVFVAKEVISPEDRLKQLITGKNKRKDGRKLREHRKIYMKCGVVKGARGSAYVEVGGTKIIASVTGPVEMPQTLESEEQGFLNCEVRFSQFSCKSREEEEELGTEIEAVTDGLNRALEPVITKEEFSNVQVNIVIVVVESDGNVMSTAVNAATLAVANGRLPMSDLVASATMAVKPGLTLVDPTLEEEQLFLEPLPKSDKSSHGVITLSYMSTASQVSDCIMSGSLDVNLILETLPLLKEECSNIYTQMQQVLIKDVKQNMDLILSKDKHQVNEPLTSGIQEELRKLST